MKRMQRGIRSLLFVPADDERKLAKAATSAADAIVLDLEDAVGSDSKTLARRRAIEFLDQRPADLSVVVRINGTDTPWFVDDVAAIAGSRAAAIMLPKATAASLAKVGDPGLPVIALVETARGVEEAHLVAADPRVHRLMLGSADLAAELGIALCADESEMHYPRARLAMASAANEKESPIDVVHLAASDTVGLRLSAERGKSLGFTGKACIHPAQLKVVNEVFSPTAAEIRDAQAVVNSFTTARAEGRAVAVSDGRMIDLPVVRQAQRVLELANSIHGKDVRFD
ncbi:HpcH/HpaI aldolase/citrate lyase family protein [Arthrobacter sp. MA-N2]|uniref:HpcH/HpaI aldolase/citrate lyase family protein n=1 Tax=Arthrobacter sp. MA-N2 TaxID=1101188 RepID=UPI0018CC7289|nr:CoA ester lyase [Arthrobacter sp. MA-N2]